MYNSKFEIPNAWGLKIETKDLKIPWTGIYFLSVSGNLDAENPLE